MYKKHNNHKKQKKLVITLPAVIIDEKITEEIAEKITDIIVNVPFENISFPVNILRDLLNNNESDGSNKTTTVGYIKSYNPDTTEFTVFIYDVFADRIGELISNNCYIDILFNAYNDNVVITKFNIVRSVTTLDKKDDED